MCLGRHEPDEGWASVPWRRGGARRDDGGATSVRILCGAYDATSPFIEGGCATDWVEHLEAPDCDLQCPGCGKWCPEELVGCAREMLISRSVFVVGCSHRAFTFSRRESEPYFSVDDVPRRGRR